MKKIFCISVNNFKCGEKTYYVSTITSSYGFIQDVFVDKVLYDEFSNQIEEFGFVDVTDYFHLKYDKKLDKLVYTLNN